MATIDKLYKSMGLPMNIKRGNPWPLDVSSLWYSYNEMKTYAEDAAGVSYVGQILALVDEEKNTATAYIIADANGTLKPVGAGPVIDEKTMMIDEESEALGLKDFGKCFYRYIPEVKDDEGNTVTEATYELTEVSDAHPWASGLEPRVVSEDGVLVLGWFEPNPTTIEGVNNQVSSIQSSVADLQKVVTDLGTEVGNPATDSEDATGIYALLETKADANKVYTKDEVDTKFATELAAIDHLRRKIVTSYADITAFIDEQGAEEAAKYIFMVPETDTTADGNTYEEYMVINGVIEVIGRWATDLTDYVTKNDLTTALDDYITNSELTTQLEGYVTDSELQEVSNEVTNVIAALNGKVDKVEGSRLITTEEAEKLEALDVAGEENYVKSVTSDFTVSDTGELSLNKDAIDLSSNTTISALQGEVNTLKNTANTNTANIATLQQSIANNASAIEALQTSTASLGEKVAANEESIGELNTKTNDLSTQLSELNDKVGQNTSDIASVVASLNNYVLKETYDKDIAEIRDILTWKDMDETPAA